MQLDTYISVLANCYLNPLMTWWRGAHTNELGSCICHCLLNGHETSKDSWGGNWQGLQRSCASAHLLFSKDHVFQTSAPLTVEAKLRVKLGEGTIGIHTVSVGPAV